MTIEVSDVVSLLRESVDVVRSLRWRNDFIPEGGSAAHWAWVQLLAPGSSVSHHAYLHAASQIGAAEDNLLALEVLLDDSQTSIAPFIVARAAIEASGRAFLLLDPALSDAERSGLAIAEKLHELETLERLIRVRVADEATPQALADLADTRKRRDQLIQEARDAEMTIPLRPSFTRVVTDVLDSSGLGDIPKITFSGLAHATPHLLVVQTYMLDEALGHEWGVGFASVDDETVLNLVIATLGPYAQAVKRQIRAYGWPPSAWSRWAGHARRVLRGGLSNRPMSQE